MNKEIIRENNINDLERFKPVLNFNFSTILLFRCISKKHAEEFVNGKIKFGKPEKWIEFENNGNKGVGDSLEGVFLATNKNDNSLFINNLKKNKENGFFIKNNLLYFRNKRTTQLFCLCFYGLNSDMFINKDVDRFGNEHYYASVHREYFSTFSGIKSEQEYFKMNELHRQVVLFIKNPPKFFEKIISFFEKLGVDRKDIIISPIDYVDLRKPFVKLIKHPYELLVKDNDFSIQSEIRIIINSTSKAFIEYMDNHKGIIDIGNIKEYVDIYENYFHDLLIEKSENELLFTLPFSVKEDVSSFSLRRIISIYVQVYNDKLPYEISSEKRNQILNSLEKIIKEKYNIVLSVSDGTINLLNVDGKIEDILDK